MQFLGVEIKITVVPVGREPRYVEITVDDSERGLVLELGFLAVFDAKHFGGKYRKTRVANRNYSLRPGLRIVGGKCDTRPQQGCEHRHS